MSGNVVFCYLDANGNPVAVSSTNPLPLLDANSIPASDAPNIIYGTDSTPAQKEYPINAAGGVVVTDGGNKISATQLPPLDHDVGKASNDTEMLALTVNAPAMCLRTDFSPPHIFFLTADPPTLLTNWADTGPLGAGDANPTGKIGLAAVNGVLNTYMRSDASPPIDQAIAPTWTGLHTFNSGVNDGDASVILGNTSPEMRFIKSNNAADEKTWRFKQTNSTWRLDTASDDLSSGQTAYAIARAGTTVVSHSFMTGNVSRLVLSDIGIQSNGGSGGWANTGNLTTSGVLSATASATTAPPLSSGVHSFANTTTGIPVLAIVNGAHAANAKTAYLQYDTQSNLNIGFANDVFSEFVAPIQIQGTFLTGTTQINTNSGTGAWTHSGPMQVIGSSFTCNVYQGDGIVMTGTAPGGVPSISTMGADNDVGLEITTKGAGGIVISRNTTVNGTLTSSTISATSTLAGLVKQGAAQANSTATDVAGLVTDFNSLLAKLRTAGVIAT